MMKRFLYGFAAVLATAFLAACTADEGTLPGNDTEPVVTLYLYAAPDGYNPDQTANLRAVPNSIVNDIYLLAELKADKDAFISSNGEEAYMERVIANGTHYDATTQDVIFENLQGAYEITAVGKTADGDCGMSAVFYKGIRWIPAGHVRTQENIVGLAGYVNVERQDDANIFRVVGYYSQLDPDLGDPGEVLTFTFDDEHKLVDFATSSDPFIMIGYDDGEGGEWYGYWNPGRYSDYCYCTMATAGSIPVGLVVLMPLENNAGSLYTDGQIALFTDSLEFLD